FSFVLTFASPTPSSRKIALLEPARAGGLRVLAAEAEDYNLLIPFVMEQARGAPIIAGPDCPEVYFLTGTAIIRDRCLLSSRNLPNLRLKRPPCCTITLQLRLRWCVSIRSFPLLSVIS